jgi:DHA1 family inner membrane transport protein
VTAIDAGAGPRLRLVLILLAIASSIVVATEFIVIGLLPVLAHDLGVSVADAGWLIGAFALAAAVLGPPLTLLAAAHPPRHVMVATLLLFAAGNAIAAWTSQYAAILVIRALQGAALPVFISVGTATVNGLALAEHRGRTLAKANWGFVIGVVGALPAGVALSEGGHWELPLLVLSGLAFIASILVAALFPTVGANFPKLGDQVGLLMRPAFLTHLALTVAAFAATFAVYSYVSVWLNAVVGMDMPEVAITLFGFGAAGFFGNLVASRIADPIPIAGTVAAVAAVTAAAAAAANYHGDMVVLAPLLAIWGAAHTAVVTLCQVRVITAGGRAPAFAMSMNISAANLGIAAGALIGGFVIDRAGLDAIAVAPIGLTLVVAAIAALTPWAGRACRRG